MILYRSVQFKMMHWYRVKIKRIVKYLKNPRVRKLSMLKSAKNKKNCRVFYYNLQLINEKQKTLINWNRFEIC